ncbi:MAG: hypothetical protein V3U60_11350 [Gammaproteobacteria bacterium]
MSNPYTSVSVSGFNASPPDDDGSEVSTNQVEWAKHKEKLADPLKTAIESIDTNVSAAFALLFGATISSHSGAYTVLTTDRGKFFEATAAMTFTLPTVASAGAAFPLAFINTSSGIMTLDGNGAETINGVASLALGPGAGAIVTCNGSLWIALVTTGMLFTDFTLAHNDISSAAGVLTLDLSTGHSFRCLLTENVTSIVVTNFPASGTRADWEVILDQDPSTAYTVVWAAKYQFAGGVDHVMSTTLGARDIVGGFTVDGDTAHDCVFRKASA